MGHFQGFSKCMTFYNPYKRKGNPDLLSGFKVVHSLVMLLKRMQNNSRWWQTFIGGVLQRLLCFSDFPLDSNALKPKVPPLIFIAQGAAQHICYFQQASIEHLMHCLQVQPCERASILAVKRNVILLEGAFFSMSSHEVHSHTRLGCTVCIIGSMMPDWILCNVLKVIVTP